MSPTSPPPRRPAAPAAPRASSRIKGVRDEKARSPNHPATGEGGARRRDRRRRRSRACRRVGLAPRPAGRKAAPGGCSDCRGSRRNRPGPQSAPRGTRCRTGRGRERPQLRPLPLKTLGDDLMCRAADSQVGLLGKPEGRQLVQMRETLEEAMAHEEGVLHVAHHRLIFSLGRRSGSSPGSCPLLAAKSLQSVEVKT